MSSGISVSILNRHNPALLQQLYLIYRCISKINLVIFVKLNQTRQKHFGHLKEEIFHWAAQLNGQWFMTHRLAANDLCSETKVCWFEIGVKSWTISRSINV